MGPPIALKTIQHIPKGGCSTQGPGRANYAPKTSRNTQNFASFPSNLAYLAKPVKFSDFDIQRARPYCTYLKSNKGRWAFLDTLKGTATTAPDLVNLEAELAVLVGPSELKLRHSVAAVRRLCGATWAPGTRRSCGQKYRALTRTPEKTLTSDRPRLPLCLGTRWSSLVLFIILICTESQMEYRAEAQIARAVCWVLAEISCVTSRRFHEAVLR
jgi:hypothetical protein